MLPELAHDPANNVEIELPTGIIRPGGELRVELRLGAATGLYWLHALEIRFEGE